MKIVTMSDTHNFHDKVVVPDGDCIVFAGDMCGYGGIDEVNDFCIWLEKLPHKHKIIVAGNHDWHFQRAPHLAKARVEEAGAVYLSDNWCDEGGVRFYGSPFQPEFCNWAFNLPRNGVGLRERWEAIPEDIDVLITHCPPQGVLDQCWDNEKVGDRYLWEADLRVKPELHVFGHIHGMYGQIKIGPTLYVNASCCNEDYEPVNEPQVVEI